MDALAGRIVAKWGKCSDMIKKIFERSRRCIHALTADAARAHQLGADVDGGTEA